MLNHKDPILSYIKSLQKSISTMHFKHASGLFLAKWRAKKEPPLNEYLIYFENEWLLSTNCGWYEGLCDRIPKQNNGLENTNNVVKTHHTLRSRLSLSHYLHNATNIIKQWSIDRSRSESSYSDAFDFECYYQHAYNWIKESGFIVRMINTNNYIVCKHKYQHLISNFQNFLNASNLYYFGHSWQ